MALAVAMTFSGCGMVGEEAYHPPEVMKGTTTTAPTSSATDSPEVTSPREDPTPAADETEELPVETVPPTDAPPTTVRRTAYSQSPCDWISADTLRNLLGRDGVAGVPTESVAFAQCEWTTGGGGPTLALRLEGPSQYYILLGDVRARRLPGVSRPAVIDGSQPASTKVAQVQLRRRTLRITLRSRTASDGDLVQVANEVIENSGL